jgi:hypothetical protein
MTSNYRFESFMMDEDDDPDAESDGAPDAPDEGEADEADDGETYEPEEDNGTMDEDEDNANSPAASTVLNTENEEDSPQESDGDSRPAHGSVPAKLSRTAGGKKKAKVGTRLRSHITGDR